MAEPQPDKSWLKPFLTPLRPIFYEMLAMSVFINLIALVVPIFSMQVYDRVIGKSGLSTLWGLVIGVALILIFAVWLGWLPADGWGEPKKWILPIMAYAAVPIATYARYARSAVLDTLNKPFVTVLRAKGLSERRVIFQHVMRNSAIPMVTIFLPMFVGIATGSIFVEAMFRVPGLGAFFVSSIDKRDYPLEMALMLLLTMMFCVSYMISDVLYAVLNPRIRIDGGER